MMLRAVTESGHVRLQDALDERGLKPHQLAKRCGVHPSTVCRWRKGERKPGRKQMLKLRDILNIPLEAWM